MGKGKKQELMQPAVELGKQAPDLAGDMSNQAAISRKVREVLGADQNEFAKYILGLDTVPPTLLARYPVLFDKVFALTNLDKKDSKLFKSLLELSILTNKIYSGSHYTRTNKDVMEDIMLRAFFNAQFRRSFGGNTRERMAFNTVVSVNERSQQLQNQGGITNKIKKWFS